MATVLERELKRQLAVEGVDYIVAIDPDGLRLVVKGRRRPAVALRWRDLLSGEAALAVALNASLVQAAKASARPPPSPSAEGAPRPPARKQRKS